MNLLLVDASGSVVEKTTLDELASRLAAAELVGHAIVAGLRLLVDRARFVEAWPGGLLLLHLLHLLAHAFDLGVDAPHRQRDLRGLLVNHLLVLLALDVVAAQLLEQEDQVFVLLGPLRQLLLGLLRGLAVLLFAQRAQELDRGVGKSGDGAASQALVLAEPVLDQADQLEQRRFATLAADDDLHAVTLDLGTTVTRLT